MNSEEERTYWMEKVRELEERNQELTQENENLKKIVGHYVNNNRWI